MRPMHPVVKERLRSQAFQDLFKDFEKGMPQMATIDGDIFEPYQGWEDDLKTVLFSSSSETVTTVAASMRLRSQFKTPECGKKLHNLRNPKTGNLGSALQISIGQQHSERGFISDAPHTFGDSCPLKAISLVCKLPAGHLGSHVPDVPAECWR
jgi:hypothetical protein